MSDDPRLNAPRATLDPLPAVAQRPDDLVSVRLAEQAPEALHELLRGFQAADEAARGDLLGPAVQRDPDHVYGGLVAVLLRLVFLRFAEARGRLRDGRGDDTLGGLFEALRRDAARSPDAMDQRFGAWARVASLFRAIDEGERRGHLFDPDAWPFLEGRPFGSVRAPGERVDPPRVSDGVVLRVLEKLLSLDGEEVSFGALDVELLGSVYENLLGFTLRRAAHVSLGVGKDPVVVDLHELLSAKPAERAASLKERTGAELTGKAAEALENATTVEALVAAIGGRRSRLTPHTIPAQGLYLQPSDARRRSGSHYTPRCLTEPVVRATLAPLLDDLAAAGDGVPTPDAILGLKVCDPAMGSGAFLIEACRQLAEALVRAWEVHGRPAEGCDADDAFADAWRRVAGRCLYGVDRNRLAVELAKLSLWLAAPAPDLPFHFLDHSLREGDSLVGLSREQIVAFDWDTSSPQRSTLRRSIESALARADVLRREADEALADVRLVGDCVVACFFCADGERARRRVLGRWHGVVEAWLTQGTGRAEVEAFVRETLREGKTPIRCFHWEVEFPEVFAASWRAMGAAPRPSSERSSGFAMIVGNPPWVSYAGRAAQPIDPARRRWYDAFYRAFAGYKNLQGLFIERAATVLRPGGRLGLIVPSSMAEQAGYGPARAAHDRLARCDEGLPDLGEDGFRGVFQPSMVLHSTARPAALAEGGDARWPIERPDVDAEALAILARLGGELLPAALFGERGLQTQGSDTDHLRPSRDDRHTVPLRAGSDLRAFQRGEPSMWADPAWFGRRLRPAEEWAAVDVLIRQTARVPIAARSDGLGFRNTLLAGFASPRYPAGFLVAYLNASLVRWSHFYRHRDARQGMPQVKIGHLRAIPAPPIAVVATLAAMGDALSSRNTGATEAELRAIDDVVMGAFGVTGAARARVERDAMRWT